MKTFFFSMLVVFSGCQHASPTPSGKSLDTPTDVEIDQANETPTTEVQLTIALGDRTSGGGGGSEIGNKPGTATPNEVAGGGGVVASKFPLRNGVFRNYPEFRATLTNNSNKTIVLTAEPSALRVEELDLNGQPLSPKYADVNFLTDPGVRQDHNTQTLSPGASMLIFFGGVEDTFRFRRSKVPQVVKYKVASLGTYSVQFGYRYFRKPDAIDGGTIGQHAGFRGVALSNKVSFDVIAPK